MEAWLEDDSGNKTPVLGTLTIGRSSKNVLRLIDENASRFHALIHSQDFGEHWLVDLGSTNGTQHCNRRVRKPTLLADGDVVEIAGQRFTFRTDSLQSTTTATAPPTTSPTRGEVKAVPLWLLLADIEGSSRLVQNLTDSQFAIMVGRWFSASREIIERNHGTINKYLGDGFFAYWEPGKDSPVQIVATIEQLRLLQGSGEPRFRVVLHHGQVAVGGGGALGEESLVGADVHFLFRMEKVAGSSGWPFVLSKAATGQLAKNFKVYPLGEREVAGFSGRHAFFAPHGSTGFPSSPV